MDTFDLVNNGDLKTNLIDNNLLVEKKLDDFKETVLLGEDIKKYYQRGTETVRALDGISITVKRGEMIAVMGPSGAGKTTLVNILACLDKPSSGTLFVNGINVTKMDEEKLVDIRRENMGFVFQRFYLIPTLTVKENVEMPLLFSRNAKNRVSTDMVLKMVGLQDRAGHLPKELSGGQMQRTAVARSLIGSPKIIFADEPTGNLDSQNSLEIVKLLRSLVNENRITVIISTHDKSIAEECDRIIHLLDGKVEKIV